MKTILIAILVGVITCAVGCGQPKTALPKDPAATDASDDVPQRARNEAPVYTQTGTKPSVDGSRSPAEDAQPTAEAGVPPEGFNPYTAPAFRDAGPLRLGRGSEPDGEVPDSEQTDVFMTSDPIHVSLAAPEVPTGSQMQLSIFEEGSNQTAWSDLQGVSSSDFVRFTLGPGDLRPGRYRAVVTIDGKSVGSRAFEVSQGKG